MWSESLEEFIVFAKYLNITKAADELHMAPSSLSRHLSALEAEMGAPLIAHGSTSLSLTAAGSIVLEDACTLTAGYRSMLEKVDKLKHATHGDIRIAYALDDRAMIDRISVARRALKGELLGSNVLSRRVRGKSSMESLSNNDADIVVDYNFKEGDVDPRIFRAVPIMDDSIIIAVPKGTFPPGRKTIRVEEVCNRFIPHPSASFDNYMDRVMSLFADCPTKPSVRYIDADDMDDFFMHTLDDDEMWAFAYRQWHDYPGSIPRSYHETCDVFEIEGVDSSLIRHAIYRCDNPNPSVALLAEELAKGE